MVDSKTVIVQRITRSCMPPSISEARLKDMGWPGQSSGTSKKGSIAGLLFRAKLRFCRGQNHEFCFSALRTGSFFFIASSLEVAFWSVLPRRTQGLAFDGTSVRQHVFTVFRIKWLFDLISVVGLRSLGAETVLSVHFAVFASVKTQVCCEKSTSGEGIGRMPATCFCCSFNAFLKKRFILQR